MNQAIDATAHLCRTIVEASSDAIIFADRGGLIRLWNRGAELVFGYSAAEAVGQSLDIIIPERLRRAHWDAFDQSVETGRTKHTDRVLTTRAVHKSGDKLYVDLSFGLAKDRERRRAGRVRSRPRLHRPLSRRACHEGTSAGARSKPRSRVAHNVIGNLRASACSRARRSFRRDPGPECSARQSDRRTAVRSRFPRRNRCTSRRFRSGCATAQPRLRAIA